MEACRRRRQRLYSVSISMLLVITTVVKIDWGGYTELRLLLRFLILSANS